MMGSIVGWRIWDLVRPICLGECMLFTVNNSGQSQSVSTLFDVIVCLSSIDIKFRQKLTHSISTPPCRFTPF